MHCDSARLSQVSYATHAVIVWFREPRLASEEIANLLDYRGRDDVSVSNFNSKEALPAA
jgi:hypothetical protein